MGLKLANSHILMGMIHLGGTTWDLGWGQAGAAEAKGGTLHFIFSISLYLLYILLKYFPNTSACRQVRKRASATILYPPRIERFLFNFSHCLRIQMVRVILSIPLWSSGPGLRFRNRFLGVGISSLIHHHLVLILQCPRSYFSNLT